MEIYCEHVGAGPELVVVHGWGMHGGIFSTWAAGFVQHAHMTIVDLPGHGRSRATSDLYDLDAVVDALVAIVPSSAAFLGWSLGGLLCLRMAERFPQRVNKLILVGTSPRFTRSEDWSPAVTAELLEQFATELKQDFRATLQRFLSLQIGFDTQARELLRALRREMFQYGEPSPVALMSGLNILRFTDLRAALPRITPPTLVLHGARDRLAPLAAARHLAEQMPNARLHTLDAAGHVPFMSHPQEFGVVLREFLHE